MKSGLYAKFLQHLSREQDQGFTLIELLVVIIIIGILSAIALPSFLSQVNKAKQSEAKQYVGTLNRSQQAYYLEKAQFASDLTQMANPIPAETKNYLYEIGTPSEGINASVVVYGTARPEISSLKSYSGGVFVRPVGDTKESSTTTVLCEEDSPSGKQASDPTDPEAGSANQPQCGADTHSLN